MQELWQDIFKGKVVIVGIGNTLRADDGLGPALIARLKGKIKAGCIDAGSAPENYTGKIIRERPDTILIVDALDLGKDPGEFAILKKNEIVKSGLSTHDISPHMLIEYLEKETQAAIYMLGVQPGDLSLGRPLSESVKLAIDKITSLIKAILITQSRM
jgi:hydrogenase 3 maturation protease